jgi:hypothetical protein
MWFKIALSYITRQTVSRLVEALYQIAKILVKFTPSIKDDELVEKIYEVISSLLPYLPEKELATIKRKLPIA